MVKDLVAFYGGGWELERRFLISRSEYQKITNGYHALDQEQRVGDNQRRVQLSFGVAEAGAGERVWGSLRHGRAFYERSALGASVATLLYVAGFVCAFARP